MGQHEISRRTFVTASGLSVATMALATTSIANRALAQGGVTQTSATPVPLGDPVPPEYGAETNWPSENRDLKSTRHAVGSGIDSNSVAGMGVVWRAPVQTSSAFGSLVANPVIVGDVVYVQDATANVYAFDKVTGDVIWKNTHDELVPSGGPNGVAVAYGNVYYTVGGPGDVIAADAATGEEIWRTNILGPLDEGITIAPLVYDSVVYVSTIPGAVDGFYQGGQRGVIHALDASHGDVIWYFDTTVDNLWGNARINSGGGLWHPPAVDDEGNLYVGVGNAAPFPGVEGYPGASSRPGDNDYANALIRIDPETASVDWYINVKPHDLFDHDNQLSPVLATLEVDGNEKSLVFSAGKHGFVVAADTESGEELWRTPVGEHNDNEFLQELGADEEIELLPGFIGGVETPIAYADGKIFAPVLNIPFTTTGVEGTGDVFNGRGELVALDAATGEILWSAEIPSTVLGGATVANDLVFTAALDGIVRAYNVEDGSLMWTFQADAGINAPLAISGDYLFVAAGAPLVPSSDSTMDVEEVTTEVIALSLGGDVQQAPSGTPESESTLEGSNVPEETGSVEEEAATAQASPIAEDAGNGSVNTVDVTAVDIAFNQTELSIAADTDVTIRLTNEGMLQHDLAIEGTDYKTDLLNSGEIGEIVVNLPSGEYTYYCTVTGHREAGMAGTLTVG